MTIPNDADIEMAELARTARLMDKAREEGKPFDPDQHAGIVRGAYESAYMAFGSVVEYVTEALLDYGVALPGDDALFDALAQAKRELGL